MKAIATFVQGMLSNIAVRTVVRCTLVVFIVMLPPTAGCRHPFGKIIEAEPHHFASLVDRDSSRQFSR